MVKLLKRTVLLAKSEASYGTDPTPTAAANAVEVFDADIKIMAPPEERPILRNTLSRKASILGERWYELTFKMYAIGSGTPATAPRHGALLKACALTETINTGASTVTYTPTPHEDNFASCTIYFYKGGRMYKITGAVGTFKLIGVAGTQVVYECKFWGIYNAAVVTEPAAHSATTYDSATALCKAGTFSYNSKTTLITQQIEIDLANTVSKRPSLSSTDAVRGFLVTERKPIASINPETEVFTSYDFIGDALVTPRAVSYVVGSVLTISIPKFNPFYPEHEDIEGILHDKLEGECTVNTGDDEISLMYSG